MRPAVSGFAPSSAANKEEYTGWLKNRILKPERKLSLEQFFVIKGIFFLQSLFVIKCPKIKSKLF